jgi:hypothetical protein
MHPLFCGLISPTPENESAISRFLHVGQALTVDTLRRGDNPI